MKELHREYYRAGSTCAQTMTFYASEDKLAHANNYVKDKYGVDGVNQAACDCALSVAKEFPYALVGGGIS